MNIVKKNLKVLILGVLLLASVTSFKTTEPLDQQEQVIPKPILFALVVPYTGNRNPFGHQLESFGNYLSGFSTNPRGGDLAIMNTDGTIRYLTAEAGFGIPSGEIQTEEGIAVRDPSISWDGCKALFSMIIGGPSKRFDQSYRENKWQIYEITNLCDVVNGAVANISKVDGQPLTYNNASPIYGTDDDVIHFISDAPYGNLDHTYPQLDEYESRETNSGVFSLDRSSKEVKHLTHSPSGDFDLFLDSFGRLLFTRWSHIQQDQQADAFREGERAQFKPVQFLDESENSDLQELTPNQVDNSKLIADDRGVRFGPFPEPRPESVNYVDGKAGIRFNEFQIWEMCEDGQRNQTINHIGRHEFGGAFTGGTFLDDNNLTDYAQAGTAFTNNGALRSRVRGFNGFFQTTEDPNNPGSYMFNYAPEFQAFASGQLFMSNIPVGANPEDVVVYEVTEDNAGNVLGRFRDGIFLSNGDKLVVHTDIPYMDNGGLYDRENGNIFHFQLKIIKQGEKSFSSPITDSGIERTIKWWGDAEDPHEITFKMMEVQPVEIMSRSIPDKFCDDYPIDPIEKSVIEEENVNIDELRAWLIENDMALIAIRDVTKRDRADVQQPYNLIVPGGVSSIATGGKEYEVSHFQPFYGSLKRGYEDKGNARRIFFDYFENTQFHPNLESVNPYDPEGPEKSIKIESDGSVALFVPATRALAWWTKSPEDKEVVVERQPLSFAPGEIMTCPGCHGINKESHDGSLTPTNKPESLRKLLTHWKNRFGPNPLGFDDEGRVGTNGFYLYQNIPNPFDGITSIKYEIPRDQHVSIHIYNMNGQKVKTLLDRKVKAGSHVLSWNGADNLGQLPEGIYMCTLVSANNRVTNKIILTSK